MAYKVKPIPLKVKPPKSPLKDKPDILVNIKLVLVVILSILSIVLIFNIVKELENKSSSTKKDVNYLITNSVQQN